MYNLSFSITYLGTIQKIYSAPPCRLGYSIPTSPIGIATLASKYRRKIPRNFFLITAATMTCHTLIEFILMQMLSLLQKRVSACLSLGISKQYFLGFIFFLYYSSAYKLVLLTPFWSVGALRRNLVFSVLQRQSVHLLQSFVFLTVVSSRHTICDFRSHNHDVHTSIAICQGYIPNYFLQNS